MSVAGHVHTSLHCMRTRMQMLSAGLPGHVHQRCRQWPLYRCGVLTPGLQVENLRSYHWTTAARNRRPPESGSSSRGTRAAPARAYLPHRSVRPRAESYAELDGEPSTSPGRILTRPRQPADTFRYVVRIHLPRTVGARPHEDCVGGLDHMPRWVAFRTPGSQLTRRVVIKVLGGRGEYCVPGSLPGSGAPTSLWEPLIGFEPTKYPRSIAMITSGPNGT